MTDYKKYALGQLENFLHDCMNAQTTTAQEIYDVIKSVVQDNYYTYKNSASQAYELLGLLNGNGKGHVSVTDTYEHSEYYYDYDRNKPIAKTSDKDNTSEESKKSSSDFWQYSEKQLDAMCDAAEERGNVKKWVLPVEYIDDECFISFPDNLLEAANLKEGDLIHWIDNGDGSYLMKKVDNVKDESVYENDWNKEYEV
jgi:hypothetical protein